MIYVSVDKKVATIKHHGKTFTITLHFDGIKIVKTTDTVQMDKGIKVNFKQSNILEVL